MSDKHRRCARCGFREHLSGPLIDAVIPTSEGVRYQCRDQAACAQRRRQKELDEQVATGPAAMAGWVYERDDEPEPAPLPPGVGGYAVGGRR